ncbi:H+-transporting two-sector ATPase, A subunit [Methanococcus vannielii SB]|uniref:H+-transporting two-sector ATPase, A subunit n=1 Tax=Methanococcus vannielii (strain ATCC 35089 / DSM 1224 / JCM 13029 / OCM 148 / SB) TaxID=406327 RepID=A6US21_METVS|nr:DUF1611 domain-containing protein [Methanococcus vannielii]ABR55293.1 H+-transporting two-sector ATPase, A subunit [Methanococcus vannielii SB]
MERAKLSHKNKVAKGIELFSTIVLDEENYDTFIWTKEILSEKEVLTWKKTIENEIIIGKNIYNMARLSRISDDFELMNLALKHGVNCFDSSNPNKFEEVKEYAKIGLNTVNAKILTIMGTSRQSGKFTTCMVLKRELEKKFNIGIIGTEPQSLLCGIDEMIIPQTIETCHSASTIFGAVKKLDLEKKDLIIVSSQTGIFSDNLEVGTGRGGGLISITVLFGSKPDFTILASDTDNLEVIKKNISAIELLSGKPVIGITLNLKNRESENLKNSIKKLENEFNLPVSDVLKGINLEKLIDSIVTNMES